MNFIVSSFILFLSLYGLPSNDRSQVSRLNAMATSYCYAGKADSAMVLSRQMLALAQQQHNAQGMGGAYNCMATVYFSGKKYDKAIIFFKKALSQYKQLGKKDLSKVEGVIACMGFTYESQNDYYRAMKCYNRSLQMARTAGDKKEIARSISSIGNLYSIQGNDSKAIDCYLKALVLMQQAGDAKGIAKNASNAGLEYKNVGNYLSALKYYNIALQAATRIKDILKEHGFARD